MDTEGLKVQFFKQEVERGIREIFEAQRKIAASGTYTQGREMRTVQRKGGGVHQRTGTLLKALSAPSFNVQQQGQGVAASSNVPMYIRFLDVKKHGNWKIYNRQIWGILYHEVRARIRYEFEDFLEQQKKNLQQSINK
jgi:hypothetical protein